MFLYLLLVFLYCFLIRIVQRFPTFFFKSKLPWQISLYSKVLLLFVYFRFLRRQVNSFLCPLYIYSKHNMTHLDFVYWTLFLYNHLCVRATGHFCVYRSSLSVLHRWNTGGSTVNNPDENWFDSGDKNANR